MGRYWPTIDDTGITAPDFATILANLTADYLAIYGADTVITEDTQDGQFLAVQAQAIADGNAIAIAVFNSFSPSKGQGAGLSSNVKINGLLRKVPSSSTVTLTIGGVANTPIDNGVASDGTHLWALPSSVTIPLAGTIDVVAACVVLGAITAAPGTITVINTPIFGWQTVTNAAAAIPGTPVETDAALRIRQAQSVALPSQTIFEGIVASINAIAGVTRSRGYENNTGSTNGLGIPANTLAFIVEGGANADIWNAIAKKITPGIPTQGAQSTTIIDASGSTRLVKFDRPTNATIAVTITLKQLPGWSASVVEPLITAAVTAFINGWAIGGDSDSKFSWSELLIAAAIIGQPGSTTFKITAIALTKNGSATSPTTNTDVVLAYNEAAVAGTVSFTVT